ncbi:hypothetical protein BZG36_00367 [Bifiguratus adelaidae]|uniref:Glucose-methanol-choline oxidoreductase N-terminal domain-containing protein n=1 Tax=Bifiguratus adelaidae TaxID=1938954 RepID=A0A261Y7V7_9FUNG|nr:hypothetical protein BZG36_00367 [Bifiguratus adelaidae]
MDSRSAAWSIGLAAAIAGFAVYTSQRKEQSSISTDIDVLANGEKAYDYVIVGGGTAGCVLARRLSEDLSVTVLLIEAGGSDEAPEVKIPVSYGKTFKSKRDWEFYTEPELTSGNRKHLWPRGKMMGGCSSNNAMMYHRGPASDFDQWAEMTDDPAWSFERVLPYFKRSEGFFPPNYPPMAKASPDSGMHGYKGPWKVSYSYLHPICEGFVKACQTAGLRLNNDFNGRYGTLGVGRIQTFIDQEAVRSNTSRAYLGHKAIQNRKNLTVITNVIVSKILLAKLGGEPKAVGVQCLRASQDPVTILAKHEVILCAGAIQSPQLLMLSGIGPKDKLEKHGIQTQCHLSGVGENLYDHLGINVIFRTQPGIATLDMMESPFKLPGLLYNYYRNRTGPLTSNIGECAAFLRLEDMDQSSASALLSHPSYVELASSRNSPHLEIISCPLYTRNHLGLDAFPNLARRRYVTFPILLLNPRSTGRMELRSSNIQDKPVIYANYLSSEQDVQTIVEGIKWVRYMVKEDKQFESQYLDGEELPGPNVIDDSALETYCREQCATYYHPVGTCKMGKTDDPTSVVDSQLRVIGVDRLRVVDASIFPKITAGHTCAPTIMIAERAADLILAARNSRMSSHLDYSYVLP